LYILCYTIGSTGETSLPSDVRFAVVKSLLESNGWQLTRISSSHHIFTKPGFPVITIPVHHDKVKAVYVRKIKKLIQKDDADAEGH